MRPRQRPTTRSQDKFWYVDIIQHAWLWIQQMLTIVQFCFHYKVLWCEHFLIKVPPITKLNHEILVVNQSGKSLFYRQPRTLDKCLYNHVITTYSLFQQCSCAMLQTGQMMMTEDNKGVDEP